MLILPEHLREEARKPFGEVFGGKAAIEACRKSARPLIAVGDQCIFDLLSAGVKIDIFVFDFKIRRVEIPQEMKKKFAPYMPEAYVVLSAPGRISDELSDAIDRVLAGGAGAVFVAGEDDLSSLLVMARAKSGTLVYGQPDQGAVVVKLGQGAAKRRALALLGKMEKG